MCLVASFLVTWAIVDWLDLLEVPENVLTPLRVLSTVFLTCGAVIWPLAWSPDKLVRAVTQPPLFFQRWLALRDLTGLQSRLHHLHPTVIPPPSKWWQIREIDLQLYRAVIAILDGKKALALRLEDSDDRIREEAGCLHTALQDIPNLEFDPLVVTLGKVAKAHDI